MTCTIMHKRKYIVHQHVRCKCMMTPPMLHAGGCGSVCNEGTLCRVQSARKCLQHARARAEPATFRLLKCLTRFGHFPEGEIRAPNAKPRIWSYKLNFFEIFQFKFKYSGPFGQKSGIGSESDKNGTPRPDQSVL